jgi:dienelactone hydrolase
VRIYDTLYQIPANVFSYHGWSVGPNDIKISVDDEGNSKLEILNKDFDFPTWVTTNSADARLSEVLECAKELRKTYSWLGYSGYCWGGGVGFKIGSQSELFNSISVAHSSTPTEEDVKAIKVPFQILAAEYDPTFPTEVKEMCNREIPKLGVDYVYHHFPGVVHGFATKVDDRVPSGKKALEQAKNAVIFWMTSHQGEKGSA